MTTISLRLPDDLLETSGAIAGRLNVSRAEYIRRAIVRMNDDMAAQAQAQRLRRASRKVRRESMRINAEFDAMEREVLDLTRPDTAASAVGEDSSPPQEPE